MALSHQRVVETAKAAEQVCSEATALLTKIKYFLALNSDIAIDWGAGSTPSYITEDVNGNISGVLFSRAQVSNAVFSLDQLRAVLENEQVTQGDHLGNINQLSSPMIYT